MQMLGCLGMNSDNIRTRPRKILNKIIHRFNHQMHIKRQRTIWFYGSNHARTDG